MRKKLLIIWDAQAKENLDGIYEYIAQDSIPAARNVKKNLIQLIQSLNDFPEKYSREEYLSDSLENYRSVSKWDYKIIFEVTNEYIIVVDIFHTSRNPSKIRKFRNK